MNLNIFSWLRSKARDAVLAGLADAVEAVAPKEAGADVDTVRRLQDRFRAEPVLLLEDIPEKRKKG